MCAASLFREHLPTLGLRWIHISNSFDPSLTLALGTEDVEIEDG